MSAFATTLAATKEDVENLAVSVKNGFDEVYVRLDDMDNRFDRIENISIGGHERRIENLEDDIRTLKTKVGIERR